MKFEIELARDILQGVEDRPALHGLDHYQMPEPPTEGLHLLMEHIQLLIEAGLLQGKVEYDNDGIPAFAFVDRLTMAGHDFLANSRKNETWEAVREAAKKAGGRITIGVATAIMNAVALGGLGLK